MIEKLLILNEGIKTIPYRCTAGKLTIGVGRNLDDRGITPEEARYLLRNDIARVQADLDKHLPWWGGLSQIRRAVMIDMAFNLEDRKNFLAYGDPKLKELVLRE